MFATIISQRSWCQAYLFQEIYQKVVECTSYSPTWLQLGWSDKDLKFSMGKYCCVPVNGNLSSYLLSIKGSSNPLHSPNNLLSIISEVLEGVVSRVISSICSSITNRSMLKLGSARIARLQFSLSLGAMNDQRVDFQKWSEGHRPWPQNTLCSNVAWTSLT